MDLQQKLKDLNPDGDLHPELIYNQQYRVFRDGKYLGVATWTQDDNVGDSFQIETTSPGYPAIEIVIADKWEILN